MSPSSRAPSSDLFDALTLPENLRWAWEKARHYYRATDGWWDEIEVAAFEANVDKELREIARQFKKNTYRMSPLKPLPQPKASADNRPCVRQAFWVSVRDQVAWLAYLNVIGPIVDAQMPAWSYGNRLYRPFWLEDPDNPKSLRIGPYRHSSGHVYRTFRTSWPRYRRHVFLTVREMSRPKMRAQSVLGRAEQDELYAQTHVLPQAERLPYLQPGFWKSAIGTPCWASLDFKRFYPNVHVGVVRDAIRNATQRHALPVGQLLQDLLTFPLDLRGWTGDELSLIQLSTRRSAFHRIPTGLMAAGFLANVALLSIDSAVDKRVREAQIAHFRYVDDHIVVAPDFGRLLDWVKWYQALLKEHDVGARFNENKFQPAAFGRYLLARQKAKSSSTQSRLRQAAVRECSLDPRFPSPLMTQTITKLSEIGKVEFDLLDDREQDQLLNDLEHLLLAEIEETDVPADTRMSFAAARIARFAPKKRQRELTTAVEKDRLRVAIEAQIKGLPSNRRAERLRLEGMHSRCARGVADLDAATRRAEQDEVERRFSLLLKALTECPEKLRLWQETLQFCRTTGHHDVAAVFELADKSRLGELGSGFLGARLTQVVARDVLVAAKVILDSDSGLRGQAAAARYLQAVSGHAVTLHRKGKYYSKAALDLLRCALGTARLLLEENEQASRQAGIDLEVLAEHSAQARAISWREETDAWCAKAGHPLSWWVWWAEREFQDAYRTEPTAMWRAISGRLDPSDDVAWSLCERYPKDLPAAAIDKLLKRETLIPQFRDGWLAEVLTSVDPSRLSRYDSRQGRKCKKILRSLQERPSDMLTLAEWAAWTAERATKHPNDPRVGEWTAVSVVEQLALLVGDRDQAGGRYSIHPLGFLVPEKWTRAKARWDSWRAVMKRQTVTLRPDFDLTDERYVSLLPGALGDHRPKVRGLAMILLGLLRRQFQWPPLMNVHGHEQPSTSPITDLIRETRCSSWTTAILEACLLPRHRETALGSTFTGMFRPPPARPQDDTTKDPPPIMDLADLAKYCRIARDVLANYQLTVRNHMARQLVPVRLDQLNKKQWFATAEEEA